MKEFFNGFLEFYKVVFSEINIRDIGVYTGVLFFLLGIFFLAKLSLDIFIIK